MPAIVPKTYKQCQEAYALLIESLAAQWREAALAYGRGGCERPYLVGTRGRCSLNCEMWSAVRVTCEPADGELPVRPEALSAAVPFGAMPALLRDYLAREPLYVFAD